MFKNVNVFLGSFVFFVFFVFFGFFVSFVLIVCVFWYDVLPIHGVVL